MNMFSDPIHNIEQLSLQSGARVADLGAGSGFYTLAAAKAVGERGRVYAVDVQKGLVDKIKKEAEAANLYNVEVVWGDIEKVGGTGLRDQSVDCVIVANVIFQLKNKENFPKEVARILKSGGRVLIVDWLESFGGMGPAFEHVFNKKSALDLFLPNGFKLERDIRAGAHHWGIILRKE